MKALLSMLAILVLAGTVAGCGGGASDMAGGVITPPVTPNVLKVEYDQPSAQLDVNFEPLGSEVVVVSEYRTEAGLGGMSTAPRGIVAPGWARFRAGTLGDLDPVPSSARVMFKIYVTDPTTGKTITEYWHWEKGVVGEGP